MCLDEAFQVGRQPGAQRSGAAKRRDGNQRVVVGSFKVAPGAFELLVADAEIEDMGTVITSVVNDEVKQQLTGACVFGVCRWRSS